MKTVCKLAHIGKRTLTEFEAARRNINESTRNKIKAFYISEGISFPTDNDREGVEIGSFDEYGNKAIEEKIEYLDLFDLDRANENIINISNFLSKIESRASISQNIIHYMIKKSGLNQKEIAQRLGLSNSFINSVSIGRKSIPLSQSEMVQSFFDEENINIKKALIQEKVLIRLFRQMKEIQEKYSIAWRSIY